MNVVDSSTRTEVCDHYSEEISHLNGLVLVSMLDLSWFIIRCFMELTLNRRTCLDR